MGRPTLPFHFPSSGRKDSPQFLCLAFCLWDIQTDALEETREGRNQSQWVSILLTMLSLGSGWSRKQGFGSLLRGDLTFCSGSEMPQPEPSIWWGSSQASLLTQPLAGAHYSTDAYIQFRCKNTWERWWTERQNERGNGRKTSETETDREQSIISPPLLSSVCKAISGCLGEIINKEKQRFRDHWCCQMPHYAK